MHNSRTCVSVLATTFAFAPLFPVSKKLASPNMAPGPRSARMRPLSETTTTCVYVLVHINMLMLMMVSCRLEVWDRHHLRSSHNFICQPRLWCLQGYFCYRRFTLIMMMHLGFLRFDVLKNIILALNELWIRMCHIYSQTHWVSSDYYQQVKWFDSSWRNTIHGASLYKWQRFASSIKKNIRMVEQNCLSSSCHNTIPLQKRCGKDDAACSHG